MIGDPFHHQLQHPHHLRRLVLIALLALLAYLLISNTAKGQPFPPVFELSSLLPENGGDGSDGFVMLGVRQFDETGYSVSGAGDINGDGLHDILVGAPYADTRLEGAAGMTYAVFGRTTGFPAAIELINLFPSGGGDGSSGFVMKGVGGLSGWSVSNAGDVNADGIDDLIIGARHADSNGLFHAGESYVVLGRQTSFPAAFELRSLFPVTGGDGSDGFVLKGVQENDNSGVSVSGLGDINGDGIDDLIVGASDADPSEISGAGESYVVFGRVSGFPAAFELASLFPAAGGDGSEGFVLKGVDYWDESGWSVSGAGDLNGDGIADVVIGAWSGDANGRLHSGETYVVFGRSTGFPATFELRSLFPAAGGDGTQGFVLKGVRNVDNSGYSVSGAGDINGDSIDDLIIGAYLADPNGQEDAGESYVVFGRQTGFPAAFELRSLFPTVGGDGSDGFVLRGVRRQDHSGIAVSAAGDVNADGIDDLVIAATDAGEGHQSWAGQTYVVFGRSTDFPPIFELSSLFPVAGGDGSTGFVLTGVDDGDHSGSAVSNAGDINGDGIDDLIIGAFFAEPYGLMEAGESYVVFGRVAEAP